MPARRPFIEVRNSPIHGRGVVAVRRIRKGTRVIEYLGKRITHDEADARYEEMDESYTTLFTIDDTWVIDAEQDGNEARFINHSCEPNCEAVLEDGRIFIYALRTIREGDELVYDYHLQRSGRFRKEWYQLYACRCGAEKCRGTMLRRRRRKKRAA